MGKEDGDVYQRTGLIVAKERAGIEEEESEDEDESDQEDEAQEAFDLKISDDTAFAEMEQAVEMNVEVFRRKETL